MWYSGIPALQGRGDVNSWGEYDDSELISQSKDMASAVERNHVQVEPLSFLDEGVGVRHLDHKIELYSHIEEFLSKNL